MDEKNTMLSKYIVEMALLEYKMMKFQPSLIASGAVNFKLNKFKGLFSVKNSKKDPLLV
jgi:hypothetical protein